MPQERFIDIAIDHGTGNSAIAVMTHQGPRILMPAPNDPTMPSAVFVYNTGALAVGHAARTAIRVQTGLRGDGVRRYKRTIGQGITYEFRGANKQMSAPEVASHVIGALLEVYRREFPDRDPRACVITVPAEFDQAALEGTREAARLAGISQIATIQEPVAAGMAFGFDSAVKTGRWLVVDLGAGTLDVTLLYKTASGLEVPKGAHDGDTSLGGTLFDELLLGHVLGELSKTYQLAKLLSPKKDDSAVQKRWGILVDHTEICKIALSNDTKVTFDTDFPLVDDHDRNISVALQVERSQYEKLIEPSVSRVIDICQRLMGRHGLGTGDLDGIILIGGPTKTPYIRERLSKALDLPLVDGIDPMTAVARGAAIFASTVALNDDPSGHASVDIAPTGLGHLLIKPESHSATPVYSLTGQLIAGAEALPGATVSARRTDGLWESRQAPVDAEGYFSLDLNLIENPRPTLSEFNLLAHDRSNRPLTDPQAISIWHPLNVAPNQTSNSMRVGLRDNRTSIMLDAGVNLPAKKTSVFRAAQSVRKGDSSSLEIPVLQSVKTLLGTEDDHLLSCKHIGSLMIQGDTLSQDLMEGEEIEVELSMDESQAISIVADVPAHNQTFTAKFQPQKYGVNPEDLVRRLHDAEIRIQVIRKVLAFEKNPRVADLLDQIVRQDTIGTVRTQAEAAMGSNSPEAVSSLSRAYERMVELFGSLNQIEALQRRAHIAWMIEDLLTIAEGHERTVVMDIRKDFESAKEDQYITLKQRLDSVNYDVRRPDLQQLAHAEVGIEAMGDTAGFTMAQRSLGREAKALSDSLFESHAWRTMNRRQLEEVREMNKRLDAAFPMMWEIRKMVREAWSKSGRDPLKMGPGSGIYLD